MKKYDRNLDPKRALGPIVVSGIIACFIFFGGFSAWSFLAPINGAAYAHGALVPEGSRRAIQHKEGGIVAEILVKEGEAVAAGQILLKLADAGTSANLSLLQRQRVVAMASAERFRAELSDASGWEPSEELKAMAKEASAEDIVVAQEDLFRTRHDAAATKRQIVGERARQAEHGIAGLDLQISSLKEQLGLIVEEEKTQQALFEKGFATKPRLLALKRAHAQLDGQIGQATSSIARSRAEIAEAQEQEQDIIKSRMDEAAAGIAAAEGELGEILEKVRAASDAVERLSIVAPISGTVMGLKAKTIGGVVLPGADIMEIVPAGERLVLEVKVPINDIDDVHSGQRAKIAFPALDQRSLPRIEGEVLEVSADRMEDPDGRVAWYAARIAIPDEELKKVGAERLKAGMAADAFIETGERTLFAWLFKPLLESIDRAFIES